MPSTFTVPTDPRDESIMTNHINGKWGRDLYSGREVCVPHADSLERTRTS